MHLPVLRGEVIENLAIASNAVILDGTLGAGGHAEAILEKSAPDGVLIGADRDPEILEFARKRLFRFGSRVRLYHARFSQLISVLDREKIPQLDGFLLDLGVSSFQLDEASRGFSFSQDGPLDMRMDPTEDTWTAAEVVNRMTERELADLIFQYGEERRSRKIAKAIVERRRKIPFSRTLDLASLIESVVGHPEKIHPATRTFQGIRIAVNRELEEIENAIPQLLSRLKTNGRGAVISFHSLEDRIVKEKFREAVQSDSFRLVTKKPLTARREEEAENRRSRSAKLRVIERVPEGGPWKRDRNSDE